jgi:hypothetical protein
MLWAILFGWWLGQRRNPEAQRKHDAAVKRAGTSKRWNAAADDHERARIAGEALMDSMNSKRRR